jgi:hypothetical protein
MRANLIIPLKFEIPELVKDGSTLENMKNIHMRLNKDMKCIEVHYLKPGFGYGVYKEGKKKQKNNEPQITLDLLLYIYIF